MNSDLEEALAVYIDRQRIEHQAELLKMLCPDQRQLRLTSVAVAPSCSPVSNETGGKFVLTAR